MTLIFPLNHFSSELWGVSNIKVYKMVTKSKQTHIETLSSITGLTPIRSCFSWPLCGTFDPGCPAPATSTSPETWGEQWNLVNSTQEIFGQSSMSMLTSRARGRRCWPGGRRRRRRGPLRFWPRRCTCPDPPGPRPWCCEHTAGPGYSASEAGTGEALCGLFGLFTNIQFWTGKINES